MSFLVHLPNLGAFIQWDAIVSVHPIAGKPGEYRLTVACGEHVQTLTLNQPDYDWLIQENGRMRASCFAAGAEARR